MKQVNAEAERVALERQLQEERKRVDYLRKELERRG